MAKENETERNRLPRKRLWLGSAVLAVAAVLSACDKDGKEPGPPSQTPTITPVATMFETATPVIQTPEITETPEVTKTPQTTPTPEILSPTTGKILVEFSPYKLWYFNLDTSEQMPVTEQVSGENTADINWSPSGDRFTVRITDKQNRLDIFEILDTKGNILAKFGDIASEPFIYPEDLSWSPDGNSIVYAQKTGIFVLDLNKKEPIQITKTDETYYRFKNPTFSPDGKKIVFAYDGSGPLEINVVDFAPEKFPYDWDEREEGRSPEWLNTIYTAEISYYSDFRFQWTKDSKNVMFAIGDYDTPNKILAVNIDNGTIQEVVTPGCNDSPAQLHQDWSLSPDEREVVFSCSFEEYKRGGIYLVDITGANKRKVLTLKDLPLDAPGDIFVCPQWTPDGKQIVFAGIENVYISNPDGSGLREVLKVPGEIRSIHWSP